MDGRIHPSWHEVMTDAVRLDVLFALTSVGSGSAGEIAQCCHASERTVKRHLQALVALGVARVGASGRDGERPGRPPTRYVIDGAVRKRAERLFQLLNQPFAPS